MEANSQSITEEFRKLLKSLLTSIYPSPDAQAIKSASRRPTKPVSESAEKMTLHAQTIGGTNEAQVNAKDGRIKIEKTAKWPHSVHGVVTFKFNGIKFWGTGTMIGPNVVLTAGHNLYSHKYKVYTENVQFLPGMNGRLLPFGLVEVEEYFVSPKYIEQNGEEKEDYGILFLKEPIGEKTGYFGLACLESEEIRSKKINVTGYPGDKVASQLDNVYEMWGMEGEAAHIDEAKGEIQYLIDTGTGQSGSGVWYKEEEDNFYVCGVHVRGNDFVNIGTLLTRAMYRQIHQWLLFMTPRNDENFYLSLKGREINKECISLLIKYKFTGLISLNLSDTKIGNEEVQQLAKNISWINLLELHLSHNRIGPEGARALAQNTSWKKLSKLYLSDNKIDSEVVKALAQNTSWINLSELYLSCNHIDTAAAKALAQNASWTKLSKLELSFNKIDPKAAKELAQNASWKNLSELYLSHNCIGTKGMRELAQNTSWANLSMLDLSFNEIDLEGAQALAQNVSWKKLSKLDLSFNNIDIEGSRVLKQNKHWRVISIVI